MVNWPDLLWENHGYMKFSCYLVPLSKRSFEFLEKIDQRNTKRSKLAASPESKQKKIISTAKTKKLNKQEFQFKRKCIWKPVITTNKETKLNLRNKKNWCQM
jgi:hypothetical protein